MMRRGKFVEMRGLAAQAAGLQRIELAVSGTPASELPDLLHQITSITKESWKSSATPSVPSAAVGVADVTHAPVPLPTAEELLNPDNLSRIIQEAGLSELLAKDPGQQVVKMETDESVGRGWIQLHIGISSFVDPVSKTRRYRCPACQVIPSTSRDTIEAHYCKFHLLRGGQCKVCSKVAFCKSNMVKHLRRTHGVGMDGSPANYGEYWDEVSLEQP